jgi:hypothetical protein
VSIACLPRASREAAHVLSDGLEQIEYAWSANLTPDLETTVLYKGESGQPIAAVRGRLVGSRAPNGLIPS